MSKRTSDRPTRNISLQHTIVAFETEAEMEAVREKLTALNPYDFSTLNHCIFVLDISHVKQTTVGSEDLDYALMIMIENPTPADMDLIETCLPTDTGHRNFALQDVDYNACEDKFIRTFHPVPLGNKLIGLSFIAHLRFMGLLNN